MLLIAVSFSLIHIRSDMDIATILQIMLTTGAASLVFGAAYFGTGKLFLPIGQYTGWNFAQQIFLEL